MCQLGLCYNINIQLFSLLKYGLSQANAFVRTQFVRWPLACTPLRSVLRFAAADPHPNLVAFKTCQQLNKLRRRGLQIVFIHVYNNNASMYDVNYEKADKNKACKS
jgi:hypothetical protein